MTKPETTAATGARTPGFAWAILGIVYLLSVSAAMLWFSAPPMASSIIPAYIVALGPENINSNFGMLMNTVAYGAIVSAIIAIFLQNKIGVKWILVLAGACLTAGAALAASSGTDYGLLNGSRVIAGLGVGFVAVSATTAISMWFNDDKRALAMALWATWVPVSMLIEYNLIVPVCAATDFHLTWWVVTVLSAVSLALCLFVYRMPRGGQISTEQTSLRSGLKYVRKRQVIALCLCFFFYNFVSHGFTTYNPTFFTLDAAAGGMGWDAALANLVASVASAAGIIAPVFGAISDRLPFKSKYVLIVIGALGYVLACCFGFKNLGLPMFIVYMLCMVVANGIVVACVRPMMPMLVGRGGFTAVTLGLALITRLEFGGQIFTSYYGMAIDAMGFSTASFAVGLPVAALMVIAAVLVKPDRELIEASEHAPAHH